MIDVVAKTEDILSRSGAERKKAESDQVYLRRCPLCGDERWKCQVSPAKGAWQCWICGGKGNLKALADALGVKFFEDGERPDRERFRVERLLTGTRPQAAKKTVSLQTVESCERALWSDQAALEYLRAERGFADLTIRRFRLGLSNGAGASWLVVPHLVGGEVANVKKRSLPPAEKDFRRIDGCASVLFNADCLEEKPEQVFVCEGELDAASLWQLGFEDAVASTCGAGTFLPEWADALERVPRIYLVYDRDRAGQLGALERARQLGWDRCWNVLVPEPHNDVNEFLAAGGRREEFLAAVEQARRFEITGAVTIGDAIRELQQESAFGAGDDGLPFVATGFRNLDELLGLFQPGDLVGLCAEAKRGKTSLALQIASENAAGGRGVAFVCMEMPVRELARKVVQCEFQCAADSLTPELLEFAEARLSGRQFYLAFIPQMTISGLRELIGFLRDCIRRYALRLVVFDHLHLLIRGSQNPEMDTATASAAFKKLATEEGCVVLLVVQPRKTEGGAEVGMRDMKYTASLGADMDRMMFLNRKETLAASEIDDDGNQHGALSPLAKLNCLSRYADGGAAWLVFEGAYSRFRRLTPSEVDEVRRAEHDSGRRSGRKRATS